MKCFNCGNEGTDYLCSDCRTESVLEKVFDEIRFYKPETCENPYLAEYAASLTEKYAERATIPTILEYFDVEINEFYFCQYYRMCRDNRFEGAALSYLETHSLDDIKTQRILYDLIESYIPNDFLKPQKWCEVITEKNDLCCELYLVAAKYFSMIGEYNISDSIVDKALSVCETGNAKFLFFSHEGMILKLTKQKEETLRYRTKKPYWPKTEERRRALARIYDEKGITYPRIESKPEKTPENEFAPPAECYDTPDSYCAFWCAAAFSVAQAKPIYQIAAVKVEQGKMVDCFQQYIRPWDGEIGRKSAAKEAGVDLSVIDSAQDVDQVMAKFFDFVGDTVLLSTDALGKQKDFLCRAARYTGMKYLPNALFDLLDFASETNGQFDMKNRAQLLQTLNIVEGTDALEKAKVNITLYEALKGYVI